MFNEITKKSIDKAFEKPAQVNINLVDAQQARRVLDRLVGYKISPLLWDKVRRGLSAGRVQTVAVRVIVEREREIRAFVKQEYWTLDANLAAKKKPYFDARLFRNGEDRRKFPIRRPRTRWLPISKARSSSSSPSAPKKSAAIR